MPSFFYLSQFSGSVMLMHVHSYYKEYSIMSICQILFMHYVIINSSLDYFQFLDIMNTFEMKVWMHMFVCAHFFLSFFFW